ncbi:DNA pilot protein [Apis mellifera associated microvirus 36]|nr:DNA pilot protein [Apis mellifera associated microvirus 36]
MKENTTQLLSVGGGLIGSLVGAWQNRKNVKDTIAANRQLAEYTYQKDLEMWNRQNAYNNPAAQMERLKAAGLNPNLVYGSGSAAGNTTGNLPRYNAPNVDYSSRQAPIDIPSVIGMYQDFQLKQAQIENVKANTDMALERTLTEPIRRQLEAERGYEKSFMNRYHLETREGYKTGIISNQAQASNLLVELNRQRIAQMIAETRNKEAAGSNIAADTLFKQYRNQWMKMGITTSDNIGFRFLSRMLNEMGINPTTWGGKIFKGR